VEWQTLLEGALGSSPIALVLGFGVWKLWHSNQAKDAEISRLNEARIQDMKQVASRNDE
jgi:hypothetical protein